MRLSTHHVIHKFVLDLHQRDDGVYTAEVKMPGNATIREFHMQGHDVCVWAQVDNEVKGRQVRKFLMVGTGREFDACKYGTYLATIFDKQWVWHLFEEKS
jgi:hypothetical protein